MTEKTLTKYPRNVDTSLEDVRNDTNDILTRGRSIFEAFGYKFTRKLVGAGDVYTYTNFLKTNEASATFTPTQNDFQIFQPDDPQHAIINTTDQDFIFTYGIQARYYKVKPKEEQVWYNDTYNESTARLYDGAILERNTRFAFLTEVEPLIIYCLYAPTEPNQEMTKYSIDTTRSAGILVNIVYIRGLLGRDPQVGDVIIPFDLPEQVFEVMQVIPTNKTLYIPRRFKLSCELVQWSL